MTKVLGVSVFVLSLMASSASWSYQDVTGWHWYNQLIDIPDKKESVKKEDELVKAFSKLPASGQLKILQMATTEMKNKAILSGRVSDIASYKEAQDFWVKKASEFTVGWEKMLLSNPSLDYSLKYTHENAFVSTAMKKRHLEEEEAVKKMAKENGLLMFYKKKDKGDVQFLSTVARYSKKYHFAFIPVSVDDGDEGRMKAHALGVNFYPALVIVNPKTRNHTIVSYGFKSQNELSERLLKLSNGWKAGF